MTSDEYMIMLKSELSQLGYDGTRISHCDIGIIAMKLSTPLLEYVVSGEGYINNNFDPRWVATCRDEMATRILLNNL